MQLLTTYLVSRVSGACFGAERILQCTDYRNDIRITMNVERIQVHCGLRISQLLQNKLFIRYDFFLFFNTSTSHTAIPSIYQQSIHSHRYQMISLTSYDTTALQLLSHQNILCDATLDTSLQNRESGMKCHSCGHSKHNEKCHKGCVRIQISLECPSGLLIERRGHNISEQSGH